MFNLGPLLERTRAFQQRLRINSQQPYLLTPGLEFLSEILPEFPALSLAQVFVKHLASARLSVNASQNQVLSGKASQLHQIQMSIEEFVRYKGELNLSIAQLQMRSNQNLRVPLFKDHQIQHLKSINLWWHRRRSLTDWHFDSHDNFIVLLQGQKELSLLQPDCPHVRFQSPFVDDNHICSVSQQGQKCSSRYSLSPGSYLFVPKGWVHRVTSSAQSIMLNFWFNSVQQTVRGRQLFFLRYLGLKLATNNLSRRIQLLSSLSLHSVMLIQNLQSFLLQADAVELQRLKGQLMQADEQTRETFWERAGERGRERLFASGSELLKGEWSKIAEQLV